MKKKINYGVVTFLAALFLVIAFLVGYGIFHAVESAKIENDLASELRSEYKLQFDNITCDVTFITSSKADVSAYLLNNPKRGETNVLVGAYTLQATKKDGKWTITYSSEPIEPEKMEVDF